MIRWEDIAKRETLYVDRFLGTIGGSREEECAAYRSYNVRDRVMIVVKILCKKYAPDRLEMKRHWDIASDERCAKGKEEGRPASARAVRVDEVMKGLCEGRIHWRGIQASPL